MHFFDDCRVLQLPNSNYLVILDCLLYIVIIGNSEPLSEFKLEHKVFILYYFGYSDPKKVSSFAITTIVCLNLCLPNLFYRSSCVFWR